MIEGKIIEVFKSSGMSRVEFAEKLGISNATLSHLASGRNKASLDLVISILNYFPDISADWLILDKGEMRRNGTNGQKFRDNMTQQLNKLDGFRKEMGLCIEVLNKELETLK